MPTITTTNRPVFDAAKAAATADGRDIAARLKIFIALEKADVTPDTLKGNGEHFAEFQSGYLTEWQTATFAAKYETANGKVKLAGTVLNRKTGAKEKVTKERAAWQRDLSSKVSKLRDSYADWLAPETADVTLDDVAGQAKGKTKGKAKSGQGAPREIAKRIADESGKLGAATQRDKDSDAKSDKIRHDVFIAAFAAIKAMAEKPAKVTDEVAAQVARLADLLK
jgi:hypothetical protein